MKSLKLDKILSFISALCFIILAASFMLPTEASEIIALPEVDVFEKIASLMANWSNLTPILKGSAIVVIVAQIIKQYVKGFKYKKILIAILSCLYGVFSLLVDGTSVGASIAIVLISYGGAPMLYDALKPFLKKYKFFDFLDLGKRQD